MISLRPYQVFGVEGIRASFRAGKKSVAFVAPTGSGKTVVMTYIAHGATGKGNRMTILVHRQELIRQTAAALGRMDVKYGLITPDATPDYSQPVQLAMVQTIVNRLDVVPVPHLLMIDEFHHAISESYRKVISRFPAARILGLTATPQRLDGRGLSSICESLVMGPTVQELIDGGFLSQPRYYAPPTDLDMQGVKRTGGDFNRKQTAERVDRPTITGSAVEHYRRLCDGMAAVAFCVSIKHAEHVRDEFRAAGIPSASIDGNLSDEDRVDRVAALETGRIKVLTSVDVISEGFDLPAVGAALLLRPTDSLALHLQQIGRVLRPAPGKTHAVILDHVGNCMRHGLAEEPREWSLAGRLGARKATNVVQTTLLTCKVCFSVHPPAPSCPTCGTIYPVKERTVPVVDGQLQQLQAAVILAERERVRKRQEIGMAKTRAELEAIAKQRGYNPKWVGMMMALRARKQYTVKFDDQLAATRQGILL